jgi:hypothetical protein
MPMLASGFGAWLVGPDANALGPVDVEIAAKGGGGFPPWGQSDGLGGGLGARAGVLPAGSGLYGGLSFLKYGGGGSSISSGSMFSPVPMPVGGSYHSFVWGVEGGYGVRFLDRLTIRGQLGLGDYIDVADTQYSTGQSATQTRHSFYLEPGVMTMVAIGPVFVGGDVNLLIATFAYQARYDAAVTLHAQLGVTF